MYESGTKSHKMSINDRKTEQEVMQMELSDKVGRSNVDMKLLN